MWHISVLLIGFTIHITLRLKVYEFNMAKFFSPNFIFKRLFSNKIQAQKYVLTKQFQGEPKKSDFQIVEEILPDLQDGGKFNKLQ